jgi:hypothetical protein
VIYHPENRKLIIRQAELLYHLAHPKSLVFTPAFKIRWLSDVNVIVCLMVVESSVGGAIRKQFALEKAAEHFTNFLKVFNIASLVTFASVIDDHKMETRTLADFQANNEICEGVIMLNAKGEHWQEILLNQFKGRIKRVQLPS